MNEFDLALKDLIEALLPGASSQIDEIFNNCKRCGIYRGDMQSIGLCEKCATRQKNIIIKGRQLGIHSLHGISQEEVNK